MSGGLNARRMKRMGNAGHRVVITGLGLMTPAGGSFEDYWQSITSGRAALRPITHFDAPDLPAAVGGEVDDSLFRPEEIPPPEAETDRALILASAAARRALSDAGVSPSPEGPEPLGIILGTGAGPTSSVESAYMTFARQGLRGLRPRTVIRTMFNSISAHLSIELHLRGPQMNVAAACASANIAMSRAFDQIHYGGAPWILTGGAEMPLCATVFSSWVAMRVLSRSSDPQACCLPFHRQRSGLVLAEGAAMFVFEEFEHARRRGAQIYGEILGYGENSDASHITFPDAATQAQAIHLALQASACRAEDIDYVNAHGTGTDANDLSETQAMKAAFGAHAAKLRISSTKSVLGHALGASGALELPAVLGAFKHQVVPPTANLTDIDPRCDLDYVPCQPKPARVETAISSSFAFGGANSVLVLRRV